MSSDLRPSDSLREEMGRIGPAPGDDALERLQHTLRAYHDSADDERALTATSNVYGDRVWTGITFGDLREIARRLA